jgi:hypothetical protein
VHARFLCAAIAGFVVALAGTGCQQDPLAGDHPPQILSVTAHPDSIGPPDSTTVLINASDPDGDALIYDWVTDARLKIKGTPANQYWLYSTAANSHVFYPGPASIHPLDTAWVQCFARDRRGGQVDRIIRITVSH